MHQLCGAFVTDVSTASRSLLTALDDVEWNGELLDLFGLAGEPLPAIVPNDAVVGTTRVFGGELPVTGLIVDQQAALLGEACILPGTAKCTFGTGAFLLACTGTTPVRSTAGLTTSAAWRLRGQTSCGNPSTLTSPPGRLTAPRTSSPAGSGPPRPRSRREPRRRERLAAPGLRRRGDRRPIVSQAGHPDIWIHVEG